MSEVNDFIRDLNIPMEYVELLGFRLKKKMLAPATSFYWFRGRKKEFVPFFLFRR